MKTKSKDDSWQYKTSKAVPIDTISTNAQVPVLKIPSQINSNIAVNEQCSVINIGLPATVAVKPRSYRKSTINCDVTRDSDTFVTKKPSVVTREFVTAKPLLIKPDNSKLSHSKMGETEGTCID